MGGRARRNALTRAEILEQFRRVTASIDPELGAPAKWAEEPLDYFLHAFRPDGARLPELFAGLPAARGVLARLQEVFAHAGPETGHLYFVVSRPAPMTDAELIAALRAWSSMLAAIIDSAGLTDDADTPMIHAMVGGDLPVDLIDRPAEPPSRHVLIGLGTEAMQWYGDRCDYRSDVADLLEEPLYMLACRYELVHWILRPLGGGKDDVLAPWAALWLAGIDHAFVGEGAALRAQAWRIRTSPPRP